MKVLIEGEWVEKLIIEPVIATDYADTWHEKLHNEKKLQEQP